MFKKRLATAAVLLVISLAALFYFPHGFWLAFVFVLVGISAWEWAGLAAYSGPVKVADALAVPALCVAAAQGLAPLQASVKLMPFALASLFWALIAPLWLGRKWQTRQPLVLALTGLLLLVPFGLGLIALRAISPVLLLQVLGVVWVADSAAYFAGRRLGRYKLAPSISPGKTWEGAVGGVIAVALYGVIWLASEYFVGSPMRGPAGLFELTAMLLLVPASIVGDLFESWMKRLAAVKDSGVLLPGHGGLLDRIDGLTAAVPVAAFAILYLRALP